MRQVDIERTVPAVTNDPVPGTPAWQPPPASFPAPSPQWDPTQPPSSTNLTPPVGQPWAAAHTQEVGATTPGAAGGGEAPGVEHGASARSRGVRAWFESEVADLKTERSSRWDERALAVRGSVEARSAESSAAKNNTGAVIALIIVGVASLALGAITFAQGHNPVPAADGWSQTTPLIRIVVAFTGPLAALWAWRRRWAIVDTPTVEIAGAHPGRCELHGTIRTDTPVTSWLTGTACVAYTAEIEEGSGKDRSTVWRSSDKALRAWLDDGTATISVNVDDLAKATSRQLGEARLTRDTRMTETGICDGDEVFLLATVRVDDGGALEVRNAPRVGDTVGRLLPSEFTAVIGGEGQARATTLITAVVATVASIAAWVSLVVFSSYERPSLTSAGDTEVRLVARVDDPLRVALTVAAVIAIFLAVGSLVRWWNRLVALRNQVDYGHSLIDVALTKRHDLIGQLTGAVRGAIEHERAVLTAATVAARWSADAAARATINARVEAYPELRTDVAFKNLFDALVSCENQIAATRRFTNDAVTLCRDRAGQFPTSLIAPAVFRRGLPELL